MVDFETAFKDFRLPPSVTMEQTGDMKQFKNSAGRMAFAIGIPLTLICASWTLLFIPLIFVLWVKNPE